MRLKGLIDEDFVNYKYPSMFIGTCFCDWKCCTEQNLDISICQNSQLANFKIIDISVEDLFHRYIQNPISKSIVIGGLEPIKQFDEILELIAIFRSNDCMDDFVIYTGYYPEEINEYLNKLKEFPNIIMKFGRYIPGQEKHFDEVLGINLVSNNQYGERIS